MKQKQNTQRSENSINSFLDIKFPQDKYHHQNSFVAQVHKNPENQEHQPIQSIKVQEKKSKIFKRQSKSDLKEVEDAYRKATELVTKMNEQRKFLKKKRTLMSEKIYNNVQESLKRITLISQQAQKQRTAKRQKIIERMDSRKKMFEIERQYKIVANQRLAQIKSNSGKKLPILKKYSSPSLQKFDHKFANKHRRSLFLENIQKEGEHQRGQEEEEQRQKYLLKEERHRIFSKIYGIRHLSHHKLNL